VEDGHQTAASDRRVHVAAGCDENYALPLAVMLASIEANLGSEVTVVAHVLQSGLDAATRHKIGASVDSRRIQIEWIAVEPRQLAVAAANVTELRHGLARVVSPPVAADAAAAALDRVIYLDCDSRPAA
jgi:lipopolysaccharide biosynthesis glycosyltransferase